MFLTSRRTAVELLLNWAAAFVASTAAAQAADWPQFRGPDGEGHGDARNLPTRWSVDENVAWRTDLPGRGWSSPVILGDKIWLTAAEPVALDDAARQAKLAKHPYGEQEFQTHGAVQLSVCEVDARSGELLRTIDLATIDDPAPIHFANSYASPTPVTDGRTLYCHFGSLGTFAVSLADAASSEPGPVRWKQRFVIDEITGPGGSPVLWNELLIFASDGVDAQAVVALKKACGEVAWRTSRPPLAKSDPKHRRAFSTPLVVRHAGEEQLIVPGAQWVVAYDPATGRERWRVSYGDGHATVPRPVFRQGLVYVCTGYPKPKLLAIDVTGRGDVTETHVRWTHDKQVPEISSPIIVDDAIYFVSAIGVATCLDARDGRLIWQHRLGGNYGASPLAADGKLYFTSQEGLTTVLRPGRQYEELARNELPRQTLASLAIWQDSLVIRTTASLFRIQNAK